MTKPAASSRNLSQSRISFIPSLIFMALGFALLAIGVVRVVFYDTSASAGAIPVISGAVVGVLSGTFLAPNSCQQTTMIQFFDKIREDRKLGESLKLVDGITDRDMAGRLQVLLALQFVDVRDMAAIHRQIVDPVKISDTFPQRQP